MERFTSVSFRNFKAFKQYSIALSSFNVLVGPNNAGKSTVITAFRILGEAMRKAKARTPEFVRGPNGDALGYRVNLAELPIAAENIFSDYDDTQPASIKFRISNGNHLILHFPERDVCHMFTETVRKPVRSPSAFRTQYDCEVAFVPVLGPVEHNEPLFQKEAARLALITHRASRNFRNIWYHYPDNFDEFRDLLRSTWPESTILIGGFSVRLGADQDDTLRQLGTVYDLKYNDNVPGNWEIVRKIAPRDVVGVVFFSNQKVVSANKNWRPDVQSTTGLAQALYEAVRVVYSGRRFLLRVHGDGRCQDCPNRYSMWTASTVGFWLDGSRNIVGHQRVNWRRVLEKEHVQV